MLLAGRNLANVLITAGRTEEGELCELRSLEY